MGPIQGMVNSAIGATTRVAATVKGLDIAEKINKENKPETSKIEGKDVKMAAKARKKVQEKINAIYSNKDLSAKARTRRVGKIIEEYNEGGK